jgi:hypothetical protein
MPLNWSTENIKYFELNPLDLWVNPNSEQTDVNPETKALILGSMALGIGNINYKSAPDFYARWKLLENYDDFYLYTSYDGDKMKCHYLTPRVVTKHFGLTTNVSTESETVWVRRIVKTYVSEFNKEYRDNLVTEQEVKAFLKNAKNEFEDSFSTPQQIGE